MVSHLYTTGLPAMSGYRFHSLFEVPYVESLRFHAGMEAEAQNRDVDAQDAPLIIRLPGLETVPSPYARNILNVAGNMSIEASAEQHSLTSQDYALKTSFDHGGNSAMHGDIRPVPLHATKITPDARDLCHRWGSSTRAIRGSVGRDRKRSVSPVEQSSDVDGNEDHVHLNTQGASSSFFADEDRGQVPGGLGSNSDHRETRGRDSVANYVSVPHNAFQRRGHLDGSDSDDSDEDDDSDRTLIFNLDDTSSETLFSSSVEHDSSDEEEDWSDGEDWDSDPDSDEVHVHYGAERNDADVEGQFSGEDGDDDDDDADQIYTPVVRTRGLWR